MVHNGCFMEDHGQNHGDRGAVSCDTAGNSPVGDLGGTMFELFPLIKWVMNMLKSPSSAYR